MTGSINKGIVLAGGHGTRLYPASGAISKQLLPVFDKPLIYYPLTTLVHLGIQDILIIVNAGDEERFQHLLGDGRHLGLRLSFMTEVRPQGIANAFLLGEDFIGSDNTALILGDNVYCSYEPLRAAVQSYDGGATVFGVHVADPAEYGVAEVDAYGEVVSIEEKPAEPKSDIAVTGLYFYDADVVRIARNLQPSERGELEITDVNKAYLDQRKLKMVTLPNDLVWFDCGTAQSMLNAGNYISSIELSTRRKIGCIEQAAYQQGLITDAQLEKLIEDMPRTEYRDYLNGLLG